MDRAWLHVMRPCFDASSNQILMETAPWVELLLHVWTCCPTMLSLRLQRAQRELQAHRSWLNAFTSRGTAIRTTHFNPSTSRTLSNSHGCRAQKQVVGKPRTAWQKKQKRKEGRVQHVGLETLSGREQLLQAAKDYDIDQVTVLYSSLPEKRPLTPEDLTTIAQCVLQCLRLESYKALKMKEREGTDKIVAFAEQLVKDIRKERLLPSVFAHVHLLGTFKQSGRHDAGIRFWEWLKEQDEEYVSADVYAVAIDLLARNGNPLEEMEQLYQDALARFPGNFSAYHLAPEAILADRESEFAVKGIPMSLLRSITVARLLGGDSKNAYLALDTAFRLYPSAIPVRLVASFKDERPVSEFFTVFAMACRAGIQLPVSYYKELVMKLRRSSFDNRSVHNHMSVIRAILAATHLHIAAGGTIPPNTVNEVTITITGILRLQGVESIEAKERSKLVDEVLAIVKKMLEVFARYGALPGEAVFNSIIINVGGYGRAKSAIGIALADMKALGIEPSEKTRRTVLAAAGLVADADLVKKSWQNILDARSQFQEPPDGLDFSLFIKSARQANISDFAREQFELLKDSFDKNSQTGLEAQFETFLGQQMSNEEKIANASSQISDGLEGLKDDTTALDMATKDRPNIQDLNGQHLPVALVHPPEWLQLPEDEVCKIYDELTTEQKAAPPSTEASEDGAATSSGSSEKNEFASRAPDTSTAPPKSITHIPYGTLRFQNWKAINYLLWLSAKHDEQYNAAVDTAIAAGVSPPQREMGIGEDEFVGLGPHPLETAQKAFKRGSPVRHAFIQRARHEIFRLRGRVDSWDLN